MNELQQAAEMAMERLQQRRGQDSITRKTTSGVCESFAKPSPSMIESGMNALEILESAPLSLDTRMKATIIVETNFGMTYDREKMTLLFDCMKEDGWTEERFLRTLRWFIRNKPFAAWTVADWYTYPGIRLYPYEWYLEQVHKFGAQVNHSIERYLLPDGKTVVYKYKDGNELPLKKFELPKRA